MRKNLVIATTFFTIFFNVNSFAALPFVTDDSFIQKPNELTLETFIEKWNEPQKARAHKQKTTLYSYYLSGSYGLNKHLELTLAGNIGYDMKNNSASFTNPILQLKTKIFESKNKAIPALAVDFGYVNKNGKGEYFDQANNYYAIAAATSRLFDDDLIVHFNLGKKASYSIPHDHLYRTHLGVALDFAINKNWRAVAESYNGAPNSPRDSPNYFQSYQAGIRWLKSDHLIFYSIVGTQPTFAGYEENSSQKLYRQTTWFQIGSRIIFDDVF